MSYRSKIKEKISTYQNVQDSVIGLEKLGFLSRLNLLLEDISSSSLNQNPNFKEDLKIIINNAVDIIWTSSSGIIRDESTQPSPDLKTQNSTEPKTPEKKSPGSPLPIFRSADLYDDNHWSRSKFIPLNKSFSNLNIIQSRSISQNTQKYNSEFSHINSPGTFSKEKRKLTESKVSSPGPGYYDYNEQKVRSKSPCAVIPKGGKRMDFAKKTETPAPTDYCPLRYFLSRPI
ncbi:unnamed protein product [Blepharisma stoltei]|uniref:Uncharacterized protein n=1 Tax=Blepharisma stoltei TaxID=1481888 RepID=A0AAU9JAJ7_9CILI|nr:unnamed protein product [Blepharisma stoltei]